jgi:hypothetical protein
MQGNELVTAVTIWTVGYVIGQIPVNLLLTRVPPRYVLCGVSVARLSQHGPDNSSNSAGVSRPWDLMQSKTTNRCTLCASWSACLSKFRL